MAVRTYQPALVSVVYATKLITGFADDSAVSIEFMTDTWGDGSGVDGLVTRNLLNDNRGTITLTLNQSSPSNDDLTAMALADKLTGTGAAPILVRDASGRTICSGDTAWITKIPSSEFGKNITNRQWTIRVANLTMFVGGNN